MVLREGLHINFYLRRPHDEVKQQVMRSLDVYLRAVGPQALRMYPNIEGEWQPLDEAGWEHQRGELLSSPSALVELADAFGEDGLQYRFEYHGRAIDDSSWENWPGVVCAVSFWLPTEYLEQHGPGRVRELALELAAPLPFAAGHAGLSFNGELGLLGVDAKVQERCFRYPGLDIPELSRRSMHIGTRAQGASWLTFLGQPVLGEMGGAAGLRSRLYSPDTTVQEMGGDRAVVTLGAWPEAGDTERGLTLPAYRELARVLEPWLYFVDHLRSHSWDRRRWERRFLD